MTDLGSSRFGAALRKVIAVGALAVTLILAPVVQFGSEGEVVSTERPDRSARRMPMPAPETIALPAATKGPPRTISFEEVLPFDPFVAIQTDAPEAPAFPTVQASWESPQNAPAKDDVQAREQRALAALGAQSPTIVVTGPEGQFVTLGNRTLRVGDRLENFRVLEITLAGLVLEELEN